jgi:MscS family membrane protein
LQRKVEVRLELDLKTPASKISDWIKETRSYLQNHVDVENYALFFSDTGRQAHIISMEYFTGMEQDIEDFNDTRSNINLAIIQSLEKQQIELAAIKTEVIIRSAV